MKTQLFIIGFSLLIGTMTSCDSSKQAQSHNSRNSLDWNGVYTGTLPCSDCEGVQTMIKLNRDLTYEREIKYLGRSNESRKESGTFSWDGSGSKITLGGQDKNDGNIYYRVGENNLTQLDKQGSRITGALANRYVLNKVNSPIMEKYWKLIEINNRAVNPPDEGAREAHMILKAVDNRVTGNSGCNSFFGSYELAGSNNISIKNIGATKMACQDMDTEFELFKLLEVADKFTVREDTLFLGKANEAPQAKFIAVYMQ